MLFKQIRLRLHQEGKLNIYSWLLISCIFCFSISFYRVLLTDSPLFFLFLNKNLFLAFIPFAISSYIVLYPKVQSSKWKFYSLVTIWFLFFPNAPYIVTDLIHLKPRMESALWLDLGILFAFAWTGLIFGMISLLDMEKIFTYRIGKTKTIFSIVVLLFITGFGIFLGRFLRWNSWDVVQQPMYLIGDILQRFIYPFDFPRTWGMTLLYGSLLNLIFWTIRGLRK